jgi:hypothetical protein
MSEQSDCVVCYENENMDILICCNQPICTTCIRKIKKNSCPHCRNEQKFTELRNATIIKLGRLIGEEEISDEKQTLINNLQHLGIVMTDINDLSLGDLFFITNTINNLTQREIVIEPGNYTLDQLLQRSAESLANNMFNSDPPVYERRRRRRPRP